MGKWKHRLTEIDREKRTAICGSCGPTRIYISPKRTRCMVVKAEEKKRERKTYTHADTLKKRYGYTGEIPQACEVCGSTHRICYDHDHNTGTHRGFLCDRCNRALGLVNDNPTTLRNLADYLER